MLDRAFSYTVFTRTFASPASLVDISELPDAGCRGAPVNSTSLRAFRRAVGFAASAYAEQSGGRARVRAHLTDVVTLRCSHLPSERHAGGFLRALYLASGSPRTVRWRRPHAAGCGEPAAPTEPGTLHLFHGLGARSDAGADDAVWLRAFVWLTPTDASPKPTKLRFTDALATAWTTPLLLRSLDLDAAARAALSRKIQEAPDAERCGGAPARASRNLLRCCDGDGDAVCAVREAALEAASPFSAELACDGSAAPRVLGVRGWWLGRGHLLGPTPPVNGTLRALYVIDDGDDDADASPTSRSPRLRLQLQDPRPAGVRLAELRGAAWPFGLHNVQLSPLLRTGSLLVVPAAVRYLVDPLRAPSASWLELAIGTSAPDGDGGDGRECSADDAAAGALATPWSETLLHGTPVYARRRRRGGKSQRDKAFGSALAAARAHLVDLSQRDAGARVSNVGGWQSVPDLLMEDATLSPLVAAVREAVIEYLAATLGAAAASSVLDVRLTGWANVNRRGDSNAMHEHLDQDWAISGVMWLDDGGDATCALRFADPRPLRTAADGDDSDGDDDEDGVAAAKPLAGQVVVFPAWLRHWVPAHCGDGARVSVAFNAAVFVDGRELPEGGLAQPQPALVEALEQAAARLAAKPPLLRRLWPTRLLSARLAPSAALRRAFDALPAPPPAAAGCARRPLSALPAPLGAALGAAVRAALARGNASAPELAITACVAAARSAAASPDSGAAASLDGFLVGFAAEDNDASDDALRLVVPDVRVAAGDLEAHIAARRRVGERVGVAAPPGGLFLFPRWSAAELVGGDGAAPVVAFSVRYV